MQVLRSPSCRITPPVEFPGDVPVFADPVGGPVTDLTS